MSSRPRARSCAAALWDVALGLSEVVAVGPRSAPPTRRVSDVRMAATRVEPRGTSYAEPIFIAVGLLSAGSGTAKSANSSIGVWRRSQLRTSFAQYTGGDVALRFLLAPSSLIPASDPTAVDVTPALLREANAHRDMIFLNMTEGLYRCASWWRERPLGSATARHPAWGCHSWLWSGLTLEQLLCRTESHERPGRGASLDRSGGLQGIPPQAAPSSTSSGCGSGRRSSPARASSC